MPYAITTPEHGTAFDIAGKGIAKTKATEEAIRITDAWLDNEFQGGRHRRRTDMLDAM